MKHFSAQKATAPDEYMKSQISIDIIRGDGKWARMLRCGITPPNYPEYATYYEYHPSLEIGEIFVYEGGYFWSTEHWREYYREYGRTPYQDMEKGDEE